MVVRPVGNENFLAHGQATHDDSPYGPFAGAGISRILPGGAAHTGQPVRPPLGIRENVIDRLGRRGARLLDPTRERHIVRLCQKRLEGIAIPDRRETEPGASEVMTAGVRCPRRTVTAGSSRRPTAHFRTRAVTRFCRSGTDPFIRTLPARLVIQICLQAYVY
jgi:hypothetical protein